MKPAIALLLLCPALALAQAGTWTTPHLGYFFDRDAKVIRVLSGVPGAAGADESLALASKLDAAWTSPSGFYALATLRDTSALQVVAWPHGSTNISSLEQAIQPTLVAFSPSGSAVVLWNHDTAKLQVWSGLPGAPTLARQTDAHAVQSAAVTDDASLLALVDDAGATLLSRTGDVQPLPFATSVQFLRNSNDLVAAFASTNQVSLFHNPGTHAEISPLAGAGDGISGPTGLALAGSSRQVAVVNSAGRSVSLIDLDTKTTTTLNCGCSPKEVAPLAGNSVFRVSGENMLVLDRQDGQWRLTAVPFQGGDR